MAITSTQRTEIVKATVAMFGAAPGGYMTELTNLFVANGSNITNFMKALATTPAFTNQAAYSNFKTVEEKATSMASAYGLTDITTAGSAGKQAYDYFVAQLTAGTNIGEIFAAANSFLASTTDTAFATTKTLLTNKTAVAEYYTVTAAGSSTTLATLQSTISSVTATTDVSTDAAKAAVISTTTAGTTGTSYTLTTGVDSITGTSSNDTITGTLIGTGVGAGSTVGVADSFDLGAGTDTMNITTAAATAFSAAILPTLTGVEVLNLKSLSAATSLVGTLAPDLTTLNLATYAAASAMTVTAASSNIKTFGITNSSQDVNDLTVTYAATGSATSSDTVTLNLSSVDATADYDVADDAAIAFEGAVAGTDQGIENFTIAATGTNNLELLTSKEVVGGNSALKSITVTGTGSLSIGTALVFDSSNTGTINASANTGGVTVEVGTIATTFTGGTGNDVLKFTTAGDLDANDTIAMGNGVDKIVIADTTVSSATTALSTAINATGAEIVGYSAAATVDMNYQTASKVAMSSTAANTTLTVNKLATTDTVVIDAGTAATSDLTVQGSLGYTTLNLELNGTVAASVAVDNVDATVNSTVNIVSNGTNATANVLDNLNLSSAANVTVTGAQALTITNALDNAAVVFNGAAMTGKLTVTGGTVASSLVGGSANDTITGGTGADTITGGAGNDTINTGANATAIGETINGGLGADIVTIGNTDANATTVVAQTVAYNATAAESYSSGSATTSTYMDSITLSNPGDDTITFTFTTGVTTAQNGALTVSTTGPTLGTTTVASAYGFYVYNAVAEADGTTAGVTYVYQDTDGDSIIESGEFAIKITGTTDASDTEAYSVSSGKLVLLATGA